MFHDDTKRNARSAPAYSNVAGYDSDEMLPNTELSGGRAAEPDLGGVLTIDPRTIGAHTPYDTMTYERALELNLECRADRQEARNAVDEFGEAGAPDPLAGMGMQQMNVQFATHATADIHNTTQPVNLAL